MGNGYHILGWGASSISAKATGTTSATAAANKTLPASNAASSARTRTPLDPYATEAPKPSFVIINKEEPTAPSSPSVPSFIIREPEAPRPTFSITREEPEAPRFLITKEPFLTRKYGGVPVWGLGALGAGGLTLLGILLKLLLSSKARFS